MRYNNQSFTVTVVELEDVGVVEGTFSGTLFDSVLGELVITDGIFSVKPVE